MLTVKDIAARNAIAAPDRTIGDVVYVRDTGQTFILDGGVTDADWKLPTGSIYDQTISTGAVAATGGVVDNEIDIVSITSGIVQLVELDITAGTSADTDVEFYDADPTGAGVLIYKAENLDIIADGAHYDPNTWWMEVAV